MTPKYRNTYFGTFGLAEEGWGGGGGEGGGEQSIDYR